MQRTVRVQSSGSAKDLGEMMAHPGPHGQLPYLTPPEAFFVWKSVKMSMFTLSGPKFSRSHPAARPRFAHPHPGNTLLRGAGWLTEPLVQEASGEGIAQHTHAHTDRHTFITYAERNVSPEEAAGARHGTARAHAHMHTHAHTRTRTRTPSSRMPRAT
jgi:hypothetical protein